MVEHGERCLLYLSYVDPSDNRWRIDVVEADEPDQFGASLAVPVLTAETTGSSWDAHQARLCTVAPTSNGFVGFYDGSASAEGNYEERTGIAVSSDLMRWTSLTPQRPWATSPHATGSVRYLDIARVDHEWFVYFEYARPDGAHDLRLARMPRVT